MLRTTQSPRFPLFQRLFDRRQPRRRKSTAKRSITHGFETLERRELLATLTVVSTADAGPGTLRAAIDEANVLPGADDIEFNIGGGGPQTISLAAPLPTITDAVTIDGSTQPGAPEITIDASATSPSDTIMRISTVGAQVQHLAITNASGTAVAIIGGSGNLVSNVDLSWTGVTPTGRGIRLESSANNVIQNVVATNRENGMTVAAADNNTIQNNNFSTAAGGNGIVAPAPSQGNRYFDNDLSNSTVALQIRGDRAFEVSGNDFSGSSFAVALALIDGSLAPGGQLVVSPDPGPGQLDIDVSNVPGTAVFFQRQTDNITLRSLDLSYAGGTATGPGVLLQGFNNIFEEITVTYRTNGISLIPGPVSTGTGNVFRANSFFENTGLGIDLGGGGVTLNDPMDPDTGVNGLQNFPELTAAEAGASTRVAGTLNSLPSTSFTLHFYANTTPDPSGFGEGEHYLGATTVTSDASGDASFDVVLPAATSLGETITATATSPDGTSEFSAGLMAQTTNTMPVFNSLIEPNACPPGGCGVSQDAGPGTVHMHSGAFTHSETDLVIPGRGFDWQFARTYRSAVSFDGPLGFNWDFADNRRLLEATPSNLPFIQANYANAQVGDVVRMDGMSRADLYVNNGSGFDAPAGFFTRLQENLDGTFTERDAAGNQVTYAAPDSNGLARILTRSDRNGNTMTYTYDVSNRLERVDDTMGRPIHYFYNTDNRIQEVRDFANRSIRFGYDGNGDLVSVTSPTVIGTPTFNDFPNGKTTRYAYSSGFADEILNHNLLSITAPNEVANGGPARTIITYENNLASPFVDHVLSQTLGGTNDSTVPAGGTITYQYQDFGPAPPNNFDFVEFRTTATDRNGNITEYDFNQRGNFLAIREFTNRNVRPSDPAFFETTFSYNGDVQRLNDTMPQGNSFARTYDQNSTLRFQQGNILQEVATADPTRSGDQAQITTQFTYEPIYNQMHTAVDPRGLDPAYVPQNGGVTSAARYTTTYTFDFQEGSDFLGLAAVLGVTTPQVQALLAAAGIPMGLGDVNGDGRTDQIAGNVVRVERPTVNLLAGSNQAGLEGDTMQEVVELSVYNDFGQLTSYTDPEGNVTEYEFYSEQDPNGDGVIDNPSGDPATGGYLRRISQDTTSDPIRNSGTNPAPVNIRNSYEYDAVGNVTRMIDGRGIATDYVVNELNQVVQVVHAAQHNLFAPDPAEPEPLVDFGYIERFIYDANNNVVRRQVEDRGNTSDVGLWGDVNGDRQVNADDIDDLYAAFNTAPTTATDLNNDGVVDQGDVDVLVLNILGTRYGDANLDGVVDGTDFNIWNSNKFQTNSGWQTGDFNGDTLTDGGDFGIWNTNKFMAGPGPQILALVDYDFEYDILDQLVEKREEVNQDHQLVTRFRYDPNQHRVLTIYPEGNATAAIYDERDKLFQTTRGQLTPPPLALLAGSDPVDYNVRGGILCQCTTYHYDLNGNIIETVDAADTDLSPDNNSDLGGLGDRTRYVFDGFDRLTSVIDSVGNQTVRQYDPASNLVRELRFGPVGGPSPTSDGPDTLPGPMSVNGVVQSANLVNGDLLSATEFLFDELNRTFQTDQVLFVNTITTVRTPDVLDGATDLGKGNLTPGDNQAISGLTGVTIVGRVSARAEYDRSSRVTFVVEDDTDTSRLFYDGASRTIQSLDPEGNKVEYAYDDSHNVIEIQETDVSQVAGVPDEIFVTTSFHDSLQRLQQRVDNVGQAMDYRYDSRGNLAAIADAQGPVTGQTISRRQFAGGAFTVNAINDFGNVTTYSYDGISRQVGQEMVLTATGEGDGVSIGASIVGIKNDPDVPASAIPTPDVTQGGGDGLIRIGTTYDDNSLTSSRIDDQGNVTLYLYDNLNRRVTETKGLTTATAPLTKALILGPREIVTPTVATINNPAVIPAAQIDAQLADAQVRLAAIASLFPPLADQVDDSPPTTIVYGYNEEDNLLIVEDENDSEFFSKYDAVNRTIATRIFRSGQSDSFGGDPVFDPNPGSDPSNPSTTFPAVIGTNKQDYQFDGLSRLVNAIDNNDPLDVDDNSVVTRAYDSLSRVIEETQLVSGFVSQTISSGWRADALRGRLTYPNSRELSYTYDDLDRLDTIGEVATTQTIVDYNYIGQNRVLERLYPINGTRMTFLNNAGTTDVGYDGLRRTVQLRHLRNDNSLIVGFGHTYDRMNNKLGETKLHDSANNENYTYDAEYRLTNFDRPGVGAITPEHSSFELDGAGNWTQVDSETRDHSSHNEITLRNDGGVTTLAYDDNGNLTDDGTYEYEWDALNRLRQVTRKSNGQLIATYAYDTGDRRVTKDVSNSGPLNGTTQFYYDGQRVLEERDGADDLVQQYVYGNYIDEVLLFSRDLDGDNSAIGGADQQLFHHQNTQFSTYAVTNDLATADIEEGYLFDAYGRTTIYEPGSNGFVEFGGDDIVTVDGVSALENPYLYTGRRLDAESGLYYYRTRYMDTELGRFISRDTIGVWGDQGNLGNGYAYVGGRPTTSLDPYGLVELLNWGNWSRHLTWAEVLGYGGPGRLFDPRWPYRQVAGGGGSGGSPYQGGNVSTLAARVTFNLTDDDADDSDDDNGSMANNPIPFRGTSASPIDWIDIAGTASPIDFIGGEIGVIWGIAGTGRSSNSVAQRVTFNLSDDDADDTEDDNGSIANNPIPRGGFTSRSNFAGGVSPRDFGGMMPGAGCVAVGNFAAVPPATAGSHFRIGYGGMGNNIDLDPIYIRIGNGWDILVGFCCF